MKRQCHFDLFCRTWLLVFGLLAAAVHSQEMPAIELDLNALEAGGVIKLDGDWYFHFGEQLSLQAIRQRLNQKLLTTVSIPQPWNKQVSELTDNRYQHGLATYVLPLTLSQTPSIALSMKVLKITDGYRLYWVPDGSDQMLPFGESGHWQLGAGFSLDNQAYHFPATHSGLLVIHVAKQQTYKGGIRRSIIIQRTDHLQASMYVEIIWRSILLGGFFIMAVHYFVQFLYVRNLQSPLLLSLVCFTALLRAFTGGGLAYIVLQNLPNSVLIFAEKIEYLGIVFPPVLYLMFFNTVAENVVPKPLVKFALYSALGISALTVLVSASWMTRHMLWYQLYLAMWALVILFFMAKAVRLKFPYARYVLFSTAVVAAAILNDVYVSHTAVYNLYLLEVGFFVFLYMQTHMVGHQLRASMATAIRLSQEKEVLEHSRNQAVLQSQQDHLTGLHNRLGLTEGLERSFGVDLKATQIGVILFDLDYFKVINDTYGHDIGDEVLIFTASILHGHALRESDFKCRYGGEEFLLILPGANMARTCDVAEAIRVRIESSIAYSDAKLNVNVTASFGVAMFTPGKSTSIKSVIIDADKALYRAKNKGRNRVECVPAGTGSAS